MWGPVAEQRLVPKQTSWDIFKSGAEVAGHRCHPLLSSLTHERTFHILWITPVGSAAGEAKGIISREWDWDKAVKEGRSGTDRLSGRLHSVHLQLCHLRPWILLFSPFFRALNPCLSCLAQTALRLISSWQGSALGTHTCPFFWSSQSHDSGTDEVSGAQRCQVISPEFTQLISVRTRCATQIFWLQTVGSTSSLFWGHRSSSLSQSWPLTRDLRAITGVHPLVCLSIYAVIFSRQLQLLSIITNM